MLLLNSQSSTEQLNEPDEKAALKSEKARQTVEGMVPLQDLHMENMSWSERLYLCQSDAAFTSIICRLRSWQIVFCRKIGKYFKDTLALSLSLSKCRLECF